ncbi:MAG: HAD family hydrolase [Micavibrio sp.]|nr:HAD family hydrolase [Micavibrio sp.]
MDLGHVKGMFFDWDGTLVDSFQLLLNAHNHVRGILGQEPFTAEGFREYFGQPREKLYAALYGEDMERAKELFVAYVVENNSEGVTLIDGAVELLELLNAQGVLCAVVTNKAPEVVEKEIEKFGLGKYFKVIIGSGHAVQDKPSGKPLLLALERAELGNAPLESIVFVGDTDNDLKCAEEVGCVSVFIENIEKYNQLIQSNKIDIHCECLRGFYDLLLQSNENAVKSMSVG